MNKFIKTQINAFKKKYSTQELIDEYINNNRFIILEIINNKINLQYAIHKDFLNRKNLFIKIIEKTLEKYKINDTIIILYSGDNYCYDNKPIFNYALPDNKLGLIFPHFSFIDYNNYDNNIDNIKQTFNNYKANVIYNDIYFKGSSSSKKQTRIREKLEYEEKPLNVIVSSKTYEEIYKIKNHKYILDLPGVKPQSIRFNLLTFSERLIIRISFYNSKKNEKSYWRQFTDFIYEGNKDYIHLVYDLDYDNKISTTNYNKIKTDILKIYNYFENNNSKYKKIVSNMTKKSKKLTFNYTLKYIAKLLNIYTKSLLLN